MSRENVQVGRRALDAFRANDFEAWIATMSPEMKVVPNACGRLSKAKPRP